MSTNVEEMGRLRVSVDEWKGNLARVGMVLASQLVEMKVSFTDHDHSLVVSRGSFQGSSGGSFGVLLGVLLVICC